MIKNNSFPDRNVLKQFILTLKENGLKPSQRFEEGEFFADDELPFVVFSDESELELVNEEFNPNKATAEAQTDSFQPPTKFISSDIKQSTNKQRAKKTPIEKLSSLFAGDALYEVEKQLLNLIFERPPLFDFSKDLADRTPEIKAKLWIEIHGLMTQYINEITNSIVSIKIQMLKDTWLNLKAGHNRYKAAVKQQSGAEAKDVMKPILWIFCIIAILFQRNDCKKIFNLIYLMY